MTNESVKTRGALRPLLWVVLAVSLAGNVALSGSADTLPIGVGLGLVVLLSGGALVLHHYRTR